MTPPKRRIATLFINGKPAARSFLTNALDEIARWQAALEACDG